MGLPVKDESLCHVCRHCEYMAKAEDEGNKICGVGECGGPAKGRAFPKYKGPLGPIALASQCFVCGEVGNIGITILDRTLACCEPHLHIANLEIDRSVLKPEDMGVVRTKRVVVPLEEALGLVPPKKDKCDQCSSPEEARLHPGTETFLCRKCWDLQESTKRGD